MYRIYPINISIYFHYIITIKFCNVLEELEEMSGKLKHSQLRINELEKELGQTRNDSNDTQKNVQRLQEVYDDLEKKYFELRYCT